jgi:hypothetical protein
VCDMYIEAIDALILLFCTQCFKAWPQALMPAFLEAPSAPRGMPHCACM